ncbi:MAG: YceD family protein, partial [candidate division WOR-3 bacterium]
MKRPWQIPVAALRQGDNVFEFEGSALELGFEPHEVAENPSFETLIGRVTARVIVTRSGSRSLVRGRVRFRTRLECAVCWQEYEQEFDEELAAELVGTQESPRVHELDSRDVEQMPLAGDVIDLFPLLRDAI